MRQDGDFKVQAKKVGADVSSVSPESQERIIKTLADLPPKALHEMTKINIRVSPDALNRMGLTEEEFAEKAKQTVSVWQANPGDIEILPSGLNVGDHFQLMQDAKQEIQSVSGANDDLMGYDSSSKSGKAKEVAMSQGQMLMRPTESNLRAFDKRMATRDLLAARSVKDLVRASGGLYDPPKRFRNW